MWTGGEIKEGNGNSNVNLPVHDWRQRREAENFRETFQFMTQLHHISLPSLCPSSPLLVALLPSPRSPIYRQHPATSLRSGGRARALFAFLSTCSTTEEEQQATAHLTVHCLGTHQPKTQHYFWDILKVYNQQGDVDVIAGVIAVQDYIVPGGC